MLLTALAGATEHIGLIATASTSYNEPYNLARRFASLDHVSGGRAGWNIVTTAGADAARNFGLDDTPAAPRPLPAGRRVRRGLHQALGQLGGRRGGRRQGARRARAGRAGPPHRPRGRVLPGRRTAERPAPAAGLPAARAGRVQRGRQGLRRPVRRGGVHRAADPGGGHRLLQGRQAAGRGRSAATRTASRSCPASSPSSATPRPRRWNWTPSSTGSSSPSTPSGSSPRR